MSTKTETKKPKIVRKISAKTVCGSIDVRKLEGDKAKPLFRIFGIVRGLKAGETDRGQFIALKGQFQARNENTMDMYVSSVCYLPRPATEMIEGAFQEGGELRFGFLISAVYNSDSVTNYEYVVEPLLETEQNDIMKQLESEVLND